MNHDFQGKRLMAPEGGEAGGPEPAGGRRPRSLSLRTAGDERDPEMTGSLDPANQSLMDALRITFRLLQLAMVVLLGLFLLSGFQSVKENERGIRLVFGKVARDNLPPGFQFSYPYPVGELVKVDQGNKELRVDEAFWVFLADQREREASLDQLPRRIKLNPANDGALLTSDGNLVHARWQIRYRRDDATSFAQNVSLEHEESIVRAAAQRGIVQAVARTTIDDLLKQTDSDEASVAMSAREIAQRMLDGMNSGIVIEQLRMTDRTPPLFVRERFTAVQTAVQNAGKKREEAESEARQILNQAAGSGVGPLLELISQYELAVEQNDEAKKNELLSRIDRTLEGRGEDGEGGGVVVSGEVTRIIAEARQYRSEIVAQRQRDAETFAAKLEQFRSNPLVMVHNEWQTGLRRFYSRGNLQLLMNPPGTDMIELVLNADPEVLKGQQRRLREEAGREAQREREEVQRREQFRTRTGLERPE